MQQLFFRKIESIESRKIESIESDFRYSVGTESRELADI
jgi:hypothetical protein